MICPSCQKQNADNARFCAYCGVGLATGAVVSQSKRKGLIIWVVVLAALVLAVWYFMPGLSDKYSKKTDSTVKEKQTADIGSQHTNLQKNDTSQRLAVDDVKQTEETGANGKPDVKLFVMSYCPFGLRMQKLYLQVYDLLKDKANMGIYFVNYSMHGKKEIDENLRQYCIEREENDKYPVYLNCFLSIVPLQKDKPVDYTKWNAAGPVNYSKCLGQAGIDNAKLNACTVETDKLFNVSANYDDKSKWLQGQYPKFEINDQLNKEYGVTGSPAIIINGVDVSSKITYYSPENLKKLVCEAFNEQPQECQTALSGNEM
ncbi:MAG: zinc ribbon domain-containing protein [Candidatus Paceibacterota bacterium]|jgi:hypothetical protein